MNFDIAIIGAGIAGASAAHELAATYKVVVLERETQPGYHTTGRSAALYTEYYGNPIIRALTIASRPFFERPPPGFADHPLLLPRGVLFVATLDQDPAVDGFLRAAAAAGDSAVEIVRAEALRKVPVLAECALHRSLFEPDARDMDVHAIHQGFLRGLRARGGQVVTDAEIRRIERRGGRWRLHTPAGDFTAARIVNAAGAWADEIARLAGVAPIGLVPKRRTALTFDPPAGIDPAPWPMVCDIEDQFYFKPEAGRLLASPGDETPSPPCDAQPEEIDLALAVERVEAATTLKIARIVRKWAGLRSFVADKTPVVGPSRDGADFFWLAGQGGYGIMTSPAMARAVAALVRGEDLPADLRARNLTAPALSPARIGA
ncbi:MAG: FAD-binding oxidoreductase [Rhodospirillales bacterium]|nr:FAD-binding oxidoreductase [Rhodospirillales bacterium]